VIQPGVARALLLMITLASLAACSKAEDNPKPGAQTERRSPPPPPVKPTLPASTTTPTATIRTFDDFQVVDLAPADGALLDQVTSWQRAAHGRTFMIETTAEWCRPCIGFAKYLDDPQMTRALAGVTLVRIDIDRFDEAALGTCKLSASSVPWFTIYDDGLVVRDAITSSEWAEDIPENMAPVLEAFVKGALQKKNG
jgi:hypothetical protein